MKKLQCLAIIPARGGSKRIPRKNLKNFLGTPIIKYSIDAALASSCFDEVMVSTEDHEIATVAKNYGAKIPFLRSPQNSNDHAMLADVIEEVLLEYKKQGISFTYFCCILATAPFVSSKRLMEGFNLLKSTGADSVVPVTRFSFPIQRAVKIEDNKLKMFWPENYSIRSQDLTPAYHDVGQFYWMKSQSLLEQKKLYATHTVPLEIPELEVQDIDTQEDWEIAELKYKILHGTHNG
ncbi:MAG: pseudaminic acid cytidylyltransferase [Flavobacterium sp.]|nr:pseudaminic acid cytidylyltransferase [Flavobacterium sp.]